MVLKVLHLSDSNLPDWRIEKAALSSKKKGYDVYFGGKKTFYHTSIFNKIFEINWTSRARNKLPIYWNNVKKQMASVIDEVRPDIIHAHNIFSAKMVKDIGNYPLVYDNHEYWTVYLKRQLETSNVLTNMKDNRNKNKKVKDSIRRITKGYLQRRYVKLWSKIEKELVRNIPTITVSSTILTELKKYGDKIYLLPNFPLREEIINITQPQYHTTLSCVYAGVEPVGPIKSSHRNLDGFVNVFENENVGKLSIIGWDSISTNNVLYKGFLNRTQMYEEMQKHSIGLIPFNKHWSHIYISPNKAYEYAHAGLYVMSTSGFKPVFDVLKENCMPFDNYDILKYKLGLLGKNLDDLYSKRLKTYEFARKNLLWENYEDNIFNAYKVS